jgi:hypothetical protein
MLTDQQKDTLRAEEEFRALVREEIEKRQPSRSRSQRIFAMLNTPVGGWFLGTVVVGLAGFVWTQYYQWTTTEARQIAETRNDAQKDVQLVTSMLPQLAKVGTPESILAVEVIRHLKDSRGIDRKLADALDGVLEKVAKDSLEQAKTSDNAEAKAAFIRSAEAAAAALDSKPGDSLVPTVSSAPGPALPAEALPPRVYIHVADELQRGPARRLAAQLRRISLLVPGIENVGMQAPRGTEVRYFNDSDRGYADDISRILVDLGETPVQVSKPALAARRGTIEVWFRRK